MALEESAVHKGPEPCLLSLPLDPTLAPSLADFPPAANSTLSYLSGVYRILTKPLTWQEAVLLCESFNASLTDVMGPYTQAFLTQAVSSVRAPLWIGLANEEVGW